MESSTIIITDNSVSDDSYCVCGSPWGADFRLKFNISPCGANFGGGQFPFCIRYSKQCSIFFSFVVRIFEWLKVLFCNCLYYKLFPLSLAGPLHIGALGMSSIISVRVYGSFTFSSADGPVGRGEVVSNWHGCWHCMFTLARVLFVL